MTLKYKDLENFVSQLKGKGFTNEIPENILFFEIRKNFGISNYIVKNIAKSLSDMNLMRPAPPRGVWVFVEKKNI